ncbi:hypothetical protein CRE_20607 [Caenorhabditis remanei]|uniref:ATP-dependent DNA helicase n=1 Tax=Caenorhabditis remanei TaxID=31234 RepID=E3NKV4_CAERE|nr:hypothetical protein CRE_20607 [Caenorhabditis remanei]
MNLRVLLIEEVSMVSSVILAAISVNLSAVRNDARPFGGVLVIVFGEFFHLEPVQHSPSYAGHPEEHQAFMATHLHWNLFTINHRLPGYANPKQMLETWIMAEAITIHKAQGLTFDGVIIVPSMDNVQMMYTALSRARSLDLCRIVKYNPLYFKTSEKVKEF